MAAQRASSSMQRASRHQPEPPPAQQAPRGFVGDAEHDAGEVKSVAVHAYEKFSNDWTMNLVAMVSYNLLTAFFPLVLALITVLALIPAASGNTAHFAAQINSILPANVSSNIKVESLLNNVNKAGGVLGLFSIAGLLWGGMNLFGAIESAFAVIFRVKTRGFLRQKLMCLAMISLFVVLLPLSFLSSVLLSSATTTLGKVMPGGASGPVGIVLGLAASLGALFILFLAIYIVVPNLPVSWRQAWRGALVAAVAMWAINALFPFYAAHFVGTKQYGAAAIGSAVLTITWFWFFSVVLLVGAQVNALAMDLGPWPYDLAGVLMRFKIPTKAGEPTAMEAAREEESPQERHSPFGVARDAQEVEDPTRGRNGGSSPGPGSGRAAGRGDARHDAAGSSTPKQLRARERPDTPRPAREMSPELVAVASAPGGVEMQTPAAVFGVPPEAQKGVLLIGSIVGLLGTALRLLRHR